MNRVRRRQFLIAAAALVVVPTSAEARQARAAYRIGWLAPGKPLPKGPYYQFLERAKELGYIEGQNLSVEYRGFQMSGEGKTFAEELVRAKVDLIVAQAPIALLAARSATETIPIITFYIGDPVRMGVVKSLARPGGNVTGFTWDTGGEWTGKTLELIKETVPRANRVAVLWNLENDSHPFYLNEVETYARALGLSSLSVGVRRTEELEGAFRKMTQGRADAVAILSDPFSVRNRETLTALLQRYPIPAWWGTAVWPLSGALITFGPDVTDHPRRAAEYMDTILKGASPANLPFQQPTRFDLIIDLKTAKALGLTIPQSILLRADRVIE